MSNRRRNSPPESSAASAWPVYDDAPDSPATAFRTAATTFLSDGNNNKPFPITFSPFTKTLNSPRSPTTVSTSTPNSLLIEAAARAAKSPNPPHRAQ
jgi:hypothetical protein